MNRPIGALEDMGCHLLPQGIKIGRVVAAKGACDEGCKDVVMQVLPTALKEVAV